MQRYEEYRTQKIESARSISAYKFTEEIVFIYKQGLRRSSGPGLFMGKE